MLKKTFRKNIIEMANLDNVFFVKSNDLNENVYKKEKFSKR